MTGNAVAAEVTQAVSAAALVGGPSCPDGVCFSPLVTVYIA